MLTPEKIEAFNKITGVKAPTDGSSGTKTRSQQIREIAQKSKQAKIDSQPEPTKSMFGINTPAISNETRRDIEETGTNISNTFKDTVNKFKETTQAAKNKEQSLPETLLQYGGQAIGGAAGIVTDAAIGAGKTMLSEQSEKAIGDTVSKVGSKVMETAPAKFLAKKYNEQSPRTQRNLEAGLNVASVVPVVKGAEIGVKTLQRGATFAEEAAPRLATKVVSSLPKPQEMLTKSITKDVDNLLKSTKPLENKAKEFTTKRNVDIKKRLQDPSIFKGLKVQGGKINTEEAVQVVGSRIDSLMDAKRAILPELDEKIMPIDREIVRQKALNSVSGSVSPADEKYLVDSINAQVDALPKVIKPSQMDNFRARFRQSGRDAKGLQKRNSEYTALENATRDTLFDATDNLPFDTNGEYIALNKEIKDLIATQEFIEKGLSGQSVKGGRLGRLFGRTIGAVAGSSGGIISTILGAGAGDAVASILINNQLGSSLKMKLIKGITDDARVLREAERVLRSAKNYNPLDTLALPEGSIKLGGKKTESSVKAVQAKPMSTVDKNTALLKDDTENAYFALNGYKGSGTNTSIRKAGAELISEFDKNPALKEVSNKSKEYVKKLEYIYRYGDADGLSWTTKPDPYFQKGNAPVQKVKVDKSILDRVIYADDADLSDMPHMNFDTIMNNKEHEIILKPKNLTTYSSNAE